MLISRNNSSLINFLRYCFFRHLRYFWWEYFQSHEEIFYDFVLLFCSVNTIICRYTIGYKFTTCFGLSTTIRYKRNFTFTFSSSAVLPYSDHCFYLGIIFSLFYTNVMYCVVSLLKLIYKNIKISTSWCQIWSLIFSALNI
jgi:hypothetical protein